MGYSVSSSFVQRSFARSPNLVREFTIAGSDYSDRVMKWPTFKKRWDDIRPKSLTMLLANGDGGMNFLRIDKTKMEGSCDVKMGFDYDTIADAAYNGEFGDLSGECGTPSGVSFSANGLIMMVVDFSVRIIFQYTLTAQWDVSTATYSGKSYSVNPEDTAPHSIYLKSGDITFYIVGYSEDTVFQYTMSTVSDISSASYSGKSFSVASQALVPTGLFFSPDGTKMFVVDYSSKAVYQYALGTAWDVSSASYNSKSFSVSDQDGTGPAGVSFKNGGTEMYVIGRGSKRVHQYALSTAWDITTAVSTGDSLYINDEDTSVLGLVFSGLSEEKLITVGYQNDKAYGYDLVKETISLHTGKIRAIEYVGETIKLTITDKFQQLSERKVGGTDTSSLVTFGGATTLPSDIAWVCVTCYGGLSTDTTSNNPDIDMAKFNAWAAVFSGDLVYVNASFTGQKVTEILRKIARNTHSAIYVNENKIHFHRFGVADPAVSSFGGDELTDVRLSFNTDQIVNKQYVSGNYSVESQYHQFTVVNVNSSSVNSFGLKEQDIKDNNFWYVSSNTAINFAQRLILTESEPDDALIADTAVNGLVRSIGETVQVVDVFHGIAQSYRVMGTEINMDRGRTRFELDRTQILDGFILDSSQINCGDILT